MADMMQAAIVRAFGPPETLEIGELPMPEPGPGEVRIRMAAAGVNFADMLMVSGQYQEKPPFPFVPGIEGAGVIDATGPDVTGLTPGTRVWATLRNGSFGQYAITEAAGAFALPDAISLEDAAAMPVAWGTAHLGLAEKGQLAAGETLLVFGAAGGVGHAAVRLGKLMGARVIAVASTDEKRALASEAGADIVLPADSDIKTAVKQAGGADVVFDPVGGAAFEVALRSARWDARIVIVGFAGGTIQQIPANILLVKNVSAQGFYWGSYRERAPDRMHASFRQLAKWYVAGDLRPHIGARFDLGEAAAALNNLGARASLGKTVIRLSSTGNAST